jgi:colicin import membrane protein
MTMASSANTSDRVMSISLSVLVHALIGGAIFYGWWQYHQAKTVPPSLAIQATVIRSAPATAPPPAPAPPPVDPAALARQQAEREHAEAEQRQAEKQATERAAADRAAAEMAAQAAHQAEAARKAQEAQRQAEEEAAAVAAERKAAAERKVAAERKAKQDAELKAKQDAAREQQRLAQQLQAEQRESELRSQVQAEEHLQALQSSPAMAEYQALIAAKISRAWNRPPSAHQGVHCIVHLKQIAGGEITNVSVDNCNGDDALRQSVETAAYRASPLPAPSDPALFDPNLTVTFAPDD